MSTTVATPPEHPTPGGIRGFLTRKVGPLEMWTWLIIGSAAGYVVYRYWAAHRATLSTASTTATTSTASGAADTGTGEDGTSSTYGYGGSSYGGNASDADYMNGGVPTNTTTGSSTQTDAQWANLAVQQLESTGVSPTDAANAVSAYLNGSTVTQAQDVYLNSVLGSIGAPQSGIRQVIVAQTPVTVAPVSTTDPANTVTATPIVAAPVQAAIPVTDPAAAPQQAAPVQQAPAVVSQPATVQQVLQQTAHTTTTYTTYTTKKGDTLRKIAVLYYGKATTDNVDGIRLSNGINAAVEYGADGVFAAGVKLSIPHTTTTYS